METVVLRSFWQGVFGVHADLKQRTLGRSPGSLGCKMLTTIIAVPALLPSEGKAVYHLSCGKDLPKTQKVQIAIQNQFVLSKTTRVY